MSQNPSQSYTGTSILDYADQKQTKYPSIVSQAETIIPIGADIVLSMKSRIRDKFGSGQYGASRDKKQREHKGIDIITVAGEEIYCPFDGNILRQTFPYKDSNLEGIFLQGVGSWQGYEAKVFYVKGIISGKIEKGQYIAHAQDLTERYPEITNHLHFEVKLRDEYIDPFEIWQMSF